MSSLLSLFSGGFFIGAKGFHPVASPISLPNTAGALFDFESNATITGGDSRYAVTEFGSNDSINLGNGNDVVTAIGSGETISLGNGNDVVTVSAMPSLSSLLSLFTHAGPTVAPITADTISLGSGTDMVFLNGSGNTINLGAGSDSITAMAGAAQNDFVLNAAGGHATITGFSTSNGDTLDLSQILAGLGVGSNPAALSNYVSVSPMVDAKHASWTDSVVSISNGAASAQVTLLNSGTLTLANLQSASLVLPTT